MQSSDACAKARVGSTRERRSKSIFACVGRRSTSSPARLIRIEPSNSFAHSPTVRPSQTSCRNARFCRGDRVNTTISFPLAAKFAPMRCPRLPVPPAISIFTTLASAGRGSSHRKLSCSATKTGRAPRQAARWLLPNRNGRRACHSCSIRFMMRALSKRAVPGGNNEASSKKLE